MSFLHEGEILLKEKYGTSLRNRLYVKPPGQSTVLVLDKKLLENKFDWFTKLFLPQGYPDSVSKDYAAYQIWDTAQAFCSTITGTLATQEVLRGVGVGDTAATAFGATVTWVVKEGCGHIGRILFACAYGTHLDAYSKKWRLCADVLNDAAMCIEMCLPLFKNNTTLVLCVSTTMKAIVGVSGGATRAALTQHHAVRGNFADVAAKDAAQETAVNLLASFAALLLITLAINPVLLFFVAMFLHITCNYFAVRAVCLRTLNETRYLLIIRDYLLREVIASPCSVNRLEPVFYYKNNIDKILCGFSIKLGLSIKKVTKYNTNYVEINKMSDIYKEKAYLLYHDIARRRMFVLLREEASTDDVLCAYFHAVLLSVVICAINCAPVALYTGISEGLDEEFRPFAQVCDTLQAAEWSRELEAGPEPGRDRKGFSYNPSTEVLTFLNKIVHREWRRFSAGLKETGWDLNKHLLLCDEWRISSHTADSKACVAEFEEHSADLLLSPNFEGANEFIRQGDGEKINGDLGIIEPDTTDSPGMLSELDLLQSKRPISHKVMFPNKTLEGDECCRPCYHKGLEPEPSPDNDNTKKDN